jgi:hypothetical protein
MADVRRIQERELKRKKGGILPQGGSVFHPS